VYILRINAPLHLMVSKGRSRQRLMCRRLLSRYMEGHDPLLESVCSGQLAVVVNAFVDSRSTHGPCWDGKGIFAATIPAPSASPSFNVLNNFVAMQHGGIENILPMSCRCGGSDRWSSVIGIWIAFKQSIAPALNWVRTAQRCLASSGNKRPSSP